MPEGQEVDISISSPIQTRDKVRQIRNAISSRIPAAQVPLRKAGLHKQLDEKDFNIASIHVAANLLRQADTDDTLKMYNRNGFLKRLQTESQTLRRLGQPATLAFIDVNGLKTINDTDGHAAGDAYLIRCAETIMDSIRSSDIVGRYGGDEILALLVGTDFQHSKLWLEKFKALMNKNGVSASVGLSAFDPDDIDGTIKKADEIMYQAKTGYYTERGETPRKT